MNASTTQPLRFSVNHLSIHDETSDKYRNFQVKGHTMDTTIPKFKLKVPKIRPKSGYIHPRKLQPGYRYPSGCPSHRPGRQVTSIYQTIQGTGITQ